MSLTSANRVFPKFELAVPFYGLAYEDAPLFPEWLAVPAHLAQAVAKRKNDYLAGRWCAYQLYQHFGLPWDGLPMGESGDPVWPRGFCGSISHTRGLAIAVMSPQSEFISLGIDLEHQIADKTAKQVHSQIVHPQEQITNNLDLTRIFSAKESIYKALNPLLNRFIGFDEVCFYDLEKMRFKAQGRLLLDFPSGASEVVTCIQSDEWILTFYGLLAKMD